MFKRKEPPQPTHVPGIHKGEELVLKVGPEPGRRSGKDYRTARDSTSINPQNRQPIHPAMPNIPPV